MTHCCSFFTLLHVTQEEGANVLDRGWNNFLQQYCSHLVRNHGDSLCDVYQTHIAPTSPSKFQFFGPHSKCILSIYLSSVFAVTLRLCQGIRGTWNNLQCRTAINATNVLGLYILFHRIPAFNGIDGLLWSLTFVHIWSYSWISSFELNEIIGSNGWKYILS